jgi:hypothetical protein
MGQRSNSHDDDVSRQFYMSFISRIFPRITTCFLTTQPGSRSSQHVHRYIQLCAVKKLRPRHMTSGSKRRIRSIGFSVGVGSRHTPRLLDVVTVMPFPNIN